MRATRLVFVEGIIGAGKTTTATRLASWLEGHGHHAVLVPEGDRRLRVATQLAHGFAPWSDTAPNDFITRCRDAWRAYVAAAARDRAITVCDGLLFHGNMTDLLLMDADRATLERYVETIREQIADLSPRLVYLRTIDVAAALAGAVSARGQSWIDYQVGWKLASPYAKALALEGEAGLIRLYEDYRDLCDSFVDGIDLPTLRLDDDRPWPERENALFAWFG